MNQIELKKYVKKLPSRPGIYIFYARDGSAFGGKKSQKKPLYIGKALNLKNRVKNYLKISDIRLRRMMSETKKLDFITTDSDIEALILESQYIKKYNPPFNIMLRDDKQYGFVGFTHSTNSGQAKKYPKIFITHQPRKESRKWKVASGKNKKLPSTFHPQPSDFIGPFTDVGALRITLKLLRRIFPYCTCRQLHNNFCLNYHIGKCYGICCLKRQSRIFNLQFSIFKEKEYGKSIKAIKDVLSGKRESLIKEFEKEMKKLAREKKFEKAMELQGKINKLKRVFQNAQLINKSRAFMIYHKGSATLNVSESLQKLLNLPSIPRRIEAYDIANIQGKHAVGAMVVFENGQSSRNEYRKFRIYGSSTSIYSGGDTGMLREILARRLDHPEWSYPDLIVVDGGRQQLHVVEAILRTTSYKLRIPIIALTKNKRHVGEKIYIAGRKDPIPLSDLTTPVKNLLLHMNAEAHRFALSYYRKLHMRKIIN